MLKLKMIINILLVLTILHYINPINNSIAGDCGEKGGGIETPTLTGDYIYPPGHNCTKDPGLKYDNANSHDTINRNGSADLFVIGNNGPFIWSVSGEGFWFDVDYTIKTLETTGLTATLYADSSACGPATITVIGCDGTQITGYVRCSTGAWVQICVFSGEPDDWDGNTGHCCSGLGIGIGGSSAGHVVYFDPAHMVYSAGCCSAAFMEGSGGDSCATLSAFSCTFPSTGLTKSMYDYVMKRFGGYGYDLQYGCFDYHYSFREWSCP